MLFAPETTTRCVCVCFTVYLTIIDRFDFRVDCRQYDHNERNERTSSASSFHFVGAIYVMPRGIYIKAFEMKFYIILYYRTKTLPGAANKTITRRIPAPFATRDKIQPPDYIAAVVVRFVVCKKGELDFSGDCGLV